MSQNPYEIGLDKNLANYTPLSPLSFLSRAAHVYPNHVSVVHGDLRHTWKQTYERCRRLASALQKRGIGKGDTVAVMLPNTPPMVEAHFGVPMSGAVLNTLNTRLNAEVLAFMLQHGEAKILITDKEFSPVIGLALRLLEKPILVIDVDDPLVVSGERLGEITYEDFLAEGDPNFEWKLPSDEWDAITLNYTSGTTGNPKGVVYHHRGAYLNALTHIADWSMPKHAIYLWTLPMFHCNGWCFPWTMAAIVGTNVCLRRMEAEHIYNIMIKEGVTHFCGAPTVYTMLLSLPEEIRKRKTHIVKSCTAGAAPPAKILESMQRDGFEITHIYGLTETYGPAVICDWHDAEWSHLPIEEQARIKARQGVRNHVLEGLMVADPVTLEPVVPNAQTMGEIMFRGNNVMKGYLKNPKATEEAFEGGWFHSGDLAVMHPDGYLEIRDRSKDIIISGGENISTIEVEDVLYRHPAVLEAAVVARPDEKWGETPCAFVTLRPGFQDTTPKEIIEFCRQHLAHFKAPRAVVFGPLPKTATGKIQKFVLRDKAKAL